MNAGTLGEWIRLERQAKSPPWTISELARRLGLSTAYLSNLEHNTSFVKGRNRRPRIETVDKVASAFADDEQDRIDKVNEARAIAGYAPLRSDQNAADSEAESRVLRSVAGGQESALLRRITIDPKIFGGKPIIRGRRLAVEHVLGMLAAGDSEDSLLEGFPWLERDDIRACLIYARRTISNERIEAIRVERAS